jgi:hypothetical protein
LPQNQHRKRESHRPTIIRLRGAIYFCLHTRQCGEKHRKRLTRDSGAKNSVKTICQIESVYRTASLADCYFNGGFSASPNFLFSASFLYSDHGPVSLHYCCAIREE